MVQKSPTHGQCQQTFRNHLKTYRMFQNAILGLWMKWKHFETGPFRQNQPKAVTVKRETLGLQPKYKVSNQITNTTNISKLGSKPPRLLGNGSNTCYLVSALFLVILRDFEHGNGWSMDGPCGAPPESLPTSIKAHALQSTVHCWRVTDLRGWMDHELISGEETWMETPSFEWTPCVHTERVSYEFHEKSHSVPLNPIKSH